MLSDPEFLKGTLDGKGQIMVGYSVYNFNMPLGTYRVKVTLNSFGDANWNYMFPMDEIEISLIICEFCAEAKAAQAYAPPVVEEEDTIIDYGGGG